MTETQRHPTSAIGTRADAFAPSSSSPARRFLIKVCLPLVVVVSGGAGAYYVYNSKPDVRQETPEAAAELVRVCPLRPTAERAIVRAMGTVIAAREVVLQPQVSGTIETLSPKLIPGGHVKADDVLFVIDSADYQAARDRAEAELARAQAELQSATWELERLKALDKQDAANRKEMDVGHTAVDVAKANVAAGRAAVDQARLDLARTTIRAPFNGIITDKSVDVGAQVAPGSKLATIVGTDEYWVRVSVPVDRLKWVDTPTDNGETGSRVRVCQSGENGSTTEWNGRVVRLLGDVEAQGRMARVLIVVEDPLGLESDKMEACPLLIGAYVRAEIEGNELEDVYAIPRRALREGDRIWLMNEKDRLAIRDVEVAWRDRQTVLIRGDFRRDSRLVVSKVAAPVAGMALRTQPPGPEPVADSHGKGKDEASGP